MTQPLVLDPQGALRFKENALVVYLLDKGGLTMNDLARVPFPIEDRQQFAQLIGYSLCGYQELSYTTELPPEIESFAFVDLKATSQVAEFLERMIPTHAPPHFAKDWQDVADALYAITNDTDAIICDQ